MPDNASMKSLAAFKIKTRRADHYDATLDKPRSTYVFVCIQYVARMMSPATGRLLKALTEDTSIHPDDLTALPADGKHVCAVIYLHLARQRERDGLLTLTRLRLDALRSQG
jgi:hypothetical protein